MKQPTRAKIRSNLILLTLLCAAGISIFLLFFYHSFSVSLQNEKKAHSKQLSAVGIGIMKYFHQLELSGKLSSAKAKHLASKALQTATHGDTGYFWVNSGKGILLMQPHTPERVGIDQTEWTDINGKYIFKDFIKKAKEGGGWVKYYWPKPTTKKEYQKISYVSYFEPWDWVLGTGLYLDEMEKNVYQVVRKASWILIGIFSLFIIIAIITANYFITQLEGLAIRDPLTDLFTKRFLEETIPRILKKHERNKKQMLTVIFIDIDHFKKINDNYGHAFGDKVLTEAAHAMQKHIRPDDICIRYGGEEFIIIGTFEDESSIFFFGERIRKAVESLVFIHKNVKISIKISAGITTYHDKESLKTTIERADKQLYKAKENGRSCIVIEY